MSVRGVLFDSGDTLLRPVGGRWNPRFDFEPIVLRYAPMLAPDDFGPVIDAGQRFLDESPRTASRDGYHRVVLAGLGIDDPPPDLLAELDRPLDIPPLEPFGEVRSVLDQLEARGVPMLIVSDNWAGMERMYEQLDLARHFTTFVVSETLGCHKPDPRMYRAGSDGLGLAPEDCVFVDDDPELVAAAIRLGYAGRVIWRAPTDPPAHVPSIAGLEELIGLFDEHVAASYRTGG
jgi:putative hydrolase of the HAD superfamily